MPEKIDAMWDDNPVDVTTETNMIWSIANKLRGPYQSDKYKDVIIPMTIIRRFECALAETKDAVVAKFKANPKYPAKAMYRISGYEFYNTSEFTLKELTNDADHLAANFRSYLKGFSANVQGIIENLDFDKQITKMDTNNRLLSVVTAFSELDLDPKTIDSIKMGYIFEDLIRRFSENAEAGDHYTGRDIIKAMVSIILAEGCEDIFEDKKIITICDQAAGTGGMLSTAYNYIKRFNATAEIKLFSQEVNPESYAECLAEMLIKGQDEEHIRKADTFQQDCFPDTRMRPRGQRLLSRRNMQKDWPGAGVPVCQVRAMRSCFSYSQLWTKWTKRWAARSSSRTAARYFRAARRREKVRSAAGCWSRICSRRLSPCQRTFFTTRVSLPICGCSRRISARPVKAKCS